MEWISVKERLPDFDCEVLLYDDWEYEGKSRSDVRVGSLKEVTQRKTSSGITNYPEWGCEYAFNITHWMPLPPPPTATK